MALEVGEIASLTTSPAYSFLESLYNSGILTETQQTLYKSRYAKLHEVVLQTYENEKNLLKKAKALNTELAGERAKLEKATLKAQEDSEAIASLRAEVGKGESELAMREERDMLLQHEIHDLQTLQAELESEINSTLKRQAAELQPQIDALEAAVEEHRADLARQKANLQKLNTERTEIAERAQSLRTQKTENEATKAQLQATLTKVKAEPDKMKKQADVVMAATQNLEMEAARLLDTIGMLDNELANHARKRKELEEERMSLAMAVERHRSQIEQKERVADEMRRNLELSREEASHALAERVRLEMDQKAVTADAKREQDLLNRRSKEYTAALKRCKKLEMQLQNSQSQIPFLERDLEETNRQMAALKDEKKKQLAAMEELRREVDIFISSFLKQESAEKEKQQLLKQLLADIKMLEEELMEASKEEQTQRKMVASLSAEREANAREAAKTVTAARETHEELKVKELVIMDLTKQLTETGSRLRDFSKLYDMVKSDRNKYVNQIQASAQALAEMKEKIKILQNEVEILRSESVAKEKALSKERLEHTNAFNARDQLRAETNKNMSAVKEKEGQVAQLIAEIDNLNSLINGIEKAMLKLKKRYEVAVEERNYTGIQLIDRNDELCILYEKSNMQQAVLKKGEVAIREKEEEIRMMDLQVAELVRDIEVTRRKLPTIPELEQQIVTLQSQLAEERALAEKLSGELEAPENSKRWRKLEGKDPEPEDLAAKLQVLEERLNDKKEQLLEKDLVLEEVTNLANRLRTQALEGREETLELAKRVNDFQGRIKVTTRRMMAAVSELSMYQATSMKLAQENQQQEALVNQQSENLQRGLPPSEEIEREWLRYEQDLSRRAQEALSRNVLQETAPALLTQTTAEPRPNAYIPDDIVGIPKPYGALAPFKPSEAGTTMRHIRKPVLREIEL
uniref:Cilia- and flagella-associated protein 58 central coiled coil domain-containing protein n=1 Tax=Chrysotila carterae TaxID=13221 RepID=A0A7S4FAG5_CHRCT|mmetsp:Transcript_23019/g.50371  ORF Transcript_23019/g.50371 Transcript_23019/m.50371 type:complete len:922 (+) Transcript_23019:189-2954(+)